MGGPWGFEYCTCHSLVGLSREEKVVVVEMKEVVVERGMENIKMYARG